MKAFFPEPGATLTLERIEDLPEVKRDKKNRLYFEIPSHLGSLGNRVVLFPNAVRDGSGRYKGVLACVALDEEEQGRGLKAFFEWENFKNFYSSLVEY